MSSSRDHIAVRATAGGSCNKAGTYGSNRGAVGVGSGKRVPESSKYRRSNRLIQTRRRILVTNTRTTSCALSWLVQTSSGRLDLAPLRCRTQSGRGKRWVSTMMINHGLTLTHPPPRAGLAAMARVTAKLSGRESFGPTCFSLYSPLLLPYGFTESSSREIPLRSFMPRQRRRRMQRYRRRTSKQPERPD